MSLRYEPFTNVWEGIYTANFTLELVRRRCLALGEVLIENGWSCLVAYDTRFMSNLFAQSIAQLFAERGVDVQLTASATPTPAVRHALAHRQANCALIVSARNQPYWYNGLVLFSPNVDNRLLQFDADIVDAAEHVFPPPADTPEALTRPPDLRSAYLDWLRGEVDVELIRRASLTIFVDAMNGTVAGYVPAVISENGQTRAIEINRDTDPLFGKVTPLPHASELTRLRKLVRESDSHLGLAFSADGTALGAVDKNGDQIELLEIVLLLAGYLARQHRQKGRIIAPLPAANSPVADIVAALNKWEDANGLKVELTTEPNDQIAQVLTQEKPNLLVGCTSQGEIVLGRYAPYPDAMLAGVLLIEMIARNGGNVRTLLDDLRSQIQKA